MQVTFSDIVQNLKSKNPSMASDFILSHKLLEYLWWIHFSWSKYKSNKDNEKIFFPINLFVLPWYLSIYEGDHKAYILIKKKLKTNKDFRYLEWYLEWAIYESLWEFIGYYYVEYLFSLDEEVYESETMGITELEQNKYFLEYDIVPNPEKYLCQRDRYVPTIQSLKVFIRKLYDKWGIKIVQDYLNQSYYWTDNTAILDFIEQNFSFNNKRGYGWAIESKYQSLSLNGDGSLIINKPYSGYGRIALWKNGKLHELFKDLLKAYPRWVKVSEKYSTVFWYSRTDKTPYHDKVFLWIKRVELRVLWIQYSPHSWFLKIENDIITLREIKIPD